MNTTKTQLPFLPSLLLTLLPNIGTKRYWELVDSFGSAEKVLNTSIESIPFLNCQAQVLLRDYQHQGSHSQLMQQATSIINTTYEHKGSIISTENRDYPQLLKHIHQPPPLLYVKGNIDNLHLPQIALVGSRHATYGGLENTRLFTRHLANSGFVITSGLALGIDGTAHHAALSVSGKTIAVMATGIDSIYPKQHQHLASQIIEKGGTLVSEFPPKTPPKANHFPRRNRIISGLSVGVLIVEAAIKSGSLITAKYALEQDREVFSIPSSIHNPQSKGCHQLIKHGAILVESSQDIIEHLQGILGHFKACSQNISTIETKQDLDVSHLSKEDHLIIKHIGFEATGIDQLILSTQLSSQELTSRLINLELEGLIKHSNWGYERV